MNLNTIQSILIESELTSLEFEYINPGGYKRYAKLIDLNRKSILNNSTYIRVYNDENEYVDNYSLDEVLIYTRHSIHDAFMIQVKCLERNKKINTFLL